MNDHIAKPIDEEMMFITMAKWIHPLHHASSPEVSQQRLSEVDNDLQQTQSKSSENQSNTKANSNFENSDELEAILNSLYGIDPYDGLKMANQNKKLYLKLLGKYRHNNDNIMASILKLAQSKSFPELKSIAHKLKGESAHLGVNQVSAIAKQLETACINGDENLTGLIIELEKELSQVLNGLSQLENAVLLEAAKNNNNDDLKQLSKKEIQQLLNEVLGLLDTDNLAAENKLNELISSYPSNQVPDEYQEISDQLFNLDYEEAKASIVKLLSS